MILAAIASREERIRLGTAVTVLSTQDPVRLYADFATLDLEPDGSPLAVTYSADELSTLVGTLAVA